MIRTLISSAVQDFMYFLNKFFKQLNYFNLLTLFPSCKSTQWLIYHVWGLLITIFNIPWTFAESFWWILGTFSRMSVVFLSRCLAVIQWAGLPSRSGCATVRTPSWREAEMGSALGAPWGEAPLRTRWMGISSPRGSPRTKREPQRVGSEGCQPPTWGITPHWCHFLWLGKKKEKKSSIAGKRQMFVWKKIEPGSVVTL